MSRLLQWGDSLRIQIFILKTGDMLALQHCWQEEVIRISMAWCSHVLLQAGSSDVESPGTFLSNIMNSQQPGAEVEPGQKAPVLQSWLCHTGETWSHG